MNDSLSAEIARQKREILRGLVDVITEEELDRKLAGSLENQRPLRVKLGVDPTSPALHLGFTVGLQKLRSFQDLGHQAVLIIGDATALVGDPTGRSKTRPRLTPEEVEAHAQGYLEQASKVLKLDETEIRRNSEWLGKLDFLGMIQLASRSTVARMLERDDFQKRHQSHLPIYIHEFLYPLLQGWDSVAVKADVELGGSDQLFNLLVGRDLQNQEGQEPQVCLTTPLLIGLDGQQKMSKSFGNWIGISEAPQDMFLKIMRLDDSLMRDYFVLATRIPQERIDEIFRTESNPRNIKEILGRAIVELYHGAAAAEEAAANFRRVVSERQLPDDLATFQLGVLGIAAEDGLPPIDLVHAAFELKSKGEARRLLSQGAIKLDDEKIEDLDVRLRPESGAILRAGRKRVVRLSWGEDS